MTPAASGPILVLNGTEERLQIALGGETLLASRELHAPGQVMRRLAPAVEDMLHQAGLAVRDLAGLACARGPGSFTGLRLVLATAMGLALAADLPLAGLDSLPLLARDLAAVTPRPVRVLTHSRRGQVYVQSFQGADGSGAPTALEPLAVMTLEEAAQAVLAGPDCLALGSGLRRNLPFFAEKLPAAWLAHAAWDCPRPETLLVAARQAAFARAPIAPLYLRASDAEDNLPQIAAARGLDLQEAEARLRRATDQTRLCREP